MRKLVATEFLSLDGVYQAPGDPNEDTEGGFRHGGWSRGYVDEVFGQAAAEGMAATDAQLFGRRTYEIMAAYWPTAPADDPYAQHLNSIQKYVASGSLTEATWQNTTILGGDAMDAVARLKEQPGGTISVLGSGKLVQSLLRAGLVDELMLAVFPIVLGSGKRLFPQGDEVSRFELVSSQPTTTGGLLLTYRPSPAS